MTTYACSNGQYYSDVQIWQRMEIGAWHVCCWDPVTGEEWMEADRHTLLHLWLVAGEHIPQDVTAESVGED